MSTGGDARALDQAGIHRVAQGNVDIPGAARSRDGGDAGPQHLPNVVGGAKRAIFDARIEIEFFERKDVAVRRMHVHVDHARHDRHVAGIDRGERPAALREGFDIGRRPDLDDPVALHKDGAALFGARAGAVEDGAVTEEIAGH